MTRAREVVVIRLKDREFKAPNGQTRVWQKRTPETIEAPSKGAKRRVTEAVPQPVSRFYKRYEQGVILRG